MLTFFGGMIILVVIFTLVFGTLFIVYATQEWSKGFQGLCVIITLAACHGDHIICDCRFYQT